MAEPPATLDSVRRTVSTVIARVVDAMTTVAIVVGLLGWSLFWTNLARLHYSQGDLLSALFTAAAFVGPAIAILGWYVGKSVGVDMPAPDIDVNALSN